LSDLARVCAIAGAIGVVLRGIGGMLAAAARRSAARAARTLGASGVVVAVDSDAEGRAMPTLRYRDHHGREHEGRSRTVGLPLQRWSVGQVVDVRYDPLDPTWVAATGAPSEAAGYALVAGIFVAVGALVLVGAAAAYATLR
jgi:hypothetical protein